MANFIESYQITNKLEGGYVNHPNDKGGETWKGIARKKNPQWPGWKIIDELKRATGFPAILEHDQRLTKLKLEFYKETFWDSLRLDRVNDSQIAKKLFDIAVNMGPVMAGKLLQKALNVSNKRGSYFPDLVVDGKVGPATILAVNKHPRPEVVFKCLNVLQGYRYIDLAEDDQSQEDFINGWFLNRVAAVIRDEDPSQNMA